MSKRFKLVLACFMLLFIWGLSFNLTTKAYEPDELIVSGGSPEYGLPSVAPDEGVVAGWGTLSFDSQSKAILDPDDPNNTVLKLSYTDVNEQFGSFFKYAQIKNSTKYEFTIDLKMTGTTVNFAMAFASPNGREELYYIKWDGYTTEPDWQDVPDKPGWKRYSIIHTTNDILAYDSIQLWFDTGKSVDNYVLIDNVQLYELDENDERVGANLITGGDFEGFLDYGVDPRVYNGDFDGWLYDYTPLPAIAFDSGVVKGWGSLSFDSHARAIADPDNPENTVLKLSYSDPNERFSSFFKFLDLEPGNYYYISLDFKIFGDAINFGMRFAPGAQDDFSILANQDKWTDVADREGWKNYTFLAYLSPNSKADSIQLWFDTNNNENNYVLLDNISVVKANVDDRGNPFIIEGEHLVLDDMTFSHGRVVAQDMKWAGNLWSNNWQLLWTNADNIPGYVNLEIGATLEYKVNVPVAGTYKIYANHTHNDDFGRFKYYINGTQVGPVFDAYSTPLRPAGEVEIGEVALNQGDNIFKVEIVDRGEGARANYLYGLDYLKLELSSAPQKEPTYSSTDVNLVSGGDFEGFLDYVPSTVIGQVPVEKGTSGGYYVPADVSVPYATVVDGEAVLKFEKTTHRIAAIRKTVNIPQIGRYTLKFDAKLPEDFEGNLFGFRFLDKDNDSHFSRTMIIENGVKKGIWTPIQNKPGWYSVEIIVDCFAEEFDTIELYLDTEDNADIFLYIDNLSLKAKSEATELFQNRLTNAHFDTFKEGLVFTKQPLLGNWSSPEEGNGAVIKYVDGNKAATLGKGEKAESLLKVALPSNLKAGSIIRLSYDFKYNYVSEEYPVMRSYFYGNAGKQHYTINLYEIFDYAFTTGDRNDYYQVRVEDNTLRGPGWQRVTLEITVDPLFLAETDSIIWAFTAFDDADELYIDNVKLFIVSQPTECPTCPQLPQCPICEECKQCPIAEPKEKDLGWIWPVASGGIVLLGVGAVLFLLKKKQ